MRFARPPRDLAVSINRYLSSRKSHSSFFYRLRKFHVYDNVKYFIRTRLIGKSCSKYYNHNVLYKSQEKPCHFFFIHTRHERIAAVAMANAHSVRLANLKASHNGNVIDGRCRRRDSWHSIRHGYMGGRQRQSYREKFQLKLLLK